MLVVVIIYFVNDHNCVVTYETQLTKATKEKLQKVNKIDD